MDAMRRWPLSVSEWPIVNPVPEVAIHFKRSRLLPVAISIRGSFLRRLLKQLTPLLAG